MAPPGPCRSSRLVAASFAHSVEIFGPTSGISSTQSGGDGIVADARSFDQSTISSAWSTIVATASVSGTTSTSSIADVITVTASQRRPPSRAWTASIMGHVATTIIVAQIPAAMNGHTTHRLAAITSPMARTESVMRPRSRAEGGS